MRSDSWQRQPGGAPNRAQGLARLIIPYLLFEGLPLRVSAAPVKAAVRLPPAMALVAIAWMVFFPLPVFPVWKGGGSKKGV